LDPEEYVIKKNAILKRCWDLAELWLAANYSSESVEWYTPARYIEGVREVLGRIDLDPASNALANKVIGASTIFTAKDNGLTRPWFGREFMNPPYGKTDDKKSLAGAFCNKAVGEYEAGNIEACIMLVNSLHSQSCQAPLYKHLFCLVDHRIQFVSGDGELNKNPTFQNIFVYLGKDRAAFTRVFKKFGYVVTEVLEAPREYDAADDFGKSYEVALDAVRARVAAGGPGWPREPDATSSERSQNVAPEMPPAADDLGIPPFLRRVP
jgi:hypothetical protein